MVDPLRGCYRGQVLLVGTQIYGDETLVAHTVRLMEYQHAFLIRSGSFGLDHTGDQPITHETLDDIHEQFAHEVTRAAATLDQRAWSSQFYRGANNEPHHLAMIMQVTPTLQQYAAAVTRTLPFLNVADYDHGGLNNRTDALPGSCMAGADARDFS